MTQVRADVLILGSGFGGSLLATILARAGKTVVLVDRTHHPRFAIGESSTPLADRTLSGIADAYGIPELKPLCHWGTWKAAHPELMCGRKRGFTYFDQIPLTDLETSDFDARRMLVSASVDDAHSDTHWLRSDVDRFVFGLAQASGVTTVEDCRYELQTARSPADPDREIWTLTGQSGTGVIACEADFLVDATGASKGVLSWLKIPDQSDRLKTRARSLFAHFADTVPSETLLKQRGIEVEGFPYHCDDAAVHQVFEDGWMWQLRFDNGVLSAGFMIDDRLADPQLAEGGPHDEWHRRLNRSPFLRRQFADATIVSPESGLVATGRIQRLAQTGAGRNWAAIVNTVGFIDPLHSSGLAHTIFSVARLAEILTTSSPDNSRHERLQRYSNQLIDELCVVDELVEGCYAGLPSFRLWCLWGMLYFAAATSMEQAPGNQLHGVGFLSSDDRSFRAMLTEARERLETCRRCATPVRDQVIAEFEVWLTDAIRPWNSVGLFDPTCQNLYSRTAAPANAW
jgi:FADH2 O2-dependent halogenase